MVRAVCIAGDAASGKTATAREVVRQRDGWRLVSTGERFRAFCREHDIPVEAVPTLPDSQHRAADAAMKETLLTEMQIVAEGRLVAYLAAEMPDVLRVFVEAPLDVRARRFAAREQVTEAEARRLLTQRDQGDREKFLRLYGIDYHDPVFYHLVIDNSHLSIEEAAALVLERMTDR